MNTKHALKYAEEPGLDVLFVVKKFNQWMIESRSEPVPKMLFGSLWLEGEMVIMSADQGMCKSLVGVQIGESIAGGRKFEPFEMTAKPQSVLYMNLKLSRGQFNMRYCEEHDAEDGNTPKTPYKFASNLHRVDIDIHAKLPDGYKTFDEVLPVLVERLVAKKKTKVVIIDNITCLQRSVYGYRETFTIMKELDKLKRRLGISILVLARTSKYGSVRESAAGSCSALFSRFADSVFMIGQSRLDASVRYIKQLVVHSSEKIYDSSHVAWFRVKRINGSFLGLEHYGFCPESEHLHPVSDERLWPLIDKVKTLSNGGEKSVRDIAAELDLPKTTVHRYLQMWTPEIGAAVNPEPLTPSTSDVAEQEKFPGSREYDEALEDPRFDPVYDEDNEDIDRYSYEYQLLDHETSLIGYASRRANKIYKETGVAPKLADDPEYAEFKRIVAAGGDPLDDDEYDADDDDNDDDDGNDDEDADDNNDYDTDEPVDDTDQSSDLDDNDDTDPVAKARISCKSSLAAWRRVLASGETLPGLQYDLNDHGKEIWIEKREKGGKPVVWYTFNSKGRKQKHVRDCNGVSTKTQSGPLTE